MTRLLAILLLAFGLGAPSAAGAAPQIGAYLWGGLLGGRKAPDGFDGSLRFLLNHGFTAVRFAVGPKTLEGYGFDPVACGPRPALACMLAPFLKAGSLDDPRLSLVMITLHDSFITFSPSYASAAVARDADVIRADHLAALAALDRRFAGRKVRIVLSNWEGDNQIYCGGVFRFARNATFARECQATRGNIADAIDGFLDWVAVRDDAIAAYRRSGGQLDVSQAPEVNNLRIFIDSCLTSCNPELTMAARILARGGSATCSYSSYDGINTGRLGAALDDLSRACHRIIVGELGFSLDRVKGERLSGLYSAAEAALASRQSVVEAVFLWNAFEDETTKDTGFGLFRADGTAFAWTRIPDSWRRTLGPRYSRNRRRAASTQQ